MNFLSHKECAEEGDTAIVYLSFANIYAVKLSRGEVFQTKYGALKHDDVIGRTYGSRINCSRGYVFVLAGTPELWTLTLPHRTQILYTRDISFVTLQLDLKPGSVVCEAGTGSGSMTHALARTVAPDGHVYTFDFHEHRAEVARKEFEEHGLNHVVTAAHRDVCQDGFGLEDTADAVFLDLPHPWKVIDAAAKALKSETGGRLCSFSPCVEQVQRTCLALRDRGFVDITTWECLERPYEVKQVTMTDLRKPASLGAFRKQKKSKKGTAVSGTPAEEAPVVSTDDAAAEVGDDNEAVDEVAEEATEDDKIPKRAFSSVSPESDGGICFQAAIPTLQIPGHTGYLTFATLLAS